MIPLKNFVLTTVMTSCTVVDVVFTMRDNVLFNFTAFPKLHVVSILLLWTDGQDGVEFF
jgi:hypothetical protein